MTSERVVDFRTRTIARSAAFGLLVSGCALAQNPAYRPARYYLFSLKPFRFSLCSLRARYLESLATFHEIRRARGAPSPILRSACFSIVPTVLPSNFAAS